MWTIILIGVLGAIISAITGTLWYGTWTPMGRWHMEYLGFEKLSEAEKKQLREEAKPKMLKIYSVQMFLSFLSAFFIAFVTSYSVQNAAPASSVFYYIPMIWLCFTVPMIGQNLLWGKISGSLSRKKFFSDSLYNLITFCIIGYIATLFF